MTLLFNELSFHAQLRKEEFRTVINRIMRLRGIAGHLGETLVCAPSLANVMVAPGWSIQQAVGSLPKEEATVIWQWISKAPFHRANHGPDDYVACGDTVVTESSVAEAAVRRVSGHSTALVSADPSEWLRSPVVVMCAIQNFEQVSIEVSNYWSEHELEAALKEVVYFPRSWSDMADHANRRYGKLHFFKNCFESLEGTPFNRSSAERVLGLLDILNEIQGSRHDDGTRSIEGQRLYQNFFTGDRAKFSDSSDSEKNNFRNRLTFSHPDGSGRELFCPWHGKEATQVLRIHFTWPVKGKDDLFVVYIGPKLTKH